MFGVGDNDGLPYYVMQFIQGLGLDEVMEEVKRLQAISGATVPPSAMSARPPRKDVSAAAMARSLVTGTFEPPSNAMAETLTQAPAANAALCASGDLSREEESTSNLSIGPSGSISLPGHSSLTGRKLTYWQSVAQIGLQVAEGLDYAHKQGVLHRDIKPSNLLLDLHGVVWVTDFGLAKASDQEDLTHTGDVLGTLRYMPPEAFEGRNDERSDLYSLGLTLYELLALRPAYDERRKELLVKHVTSTDPPRLRTLNKAIPRDVETIVHKAIEKDPSHRYKSAADLAADLRRFLADQTILARRVGPGERFVRWCKRNPTVAGLTATVFVLVSAVAIVSSILAVRIERKANEAKTAATLASQEALRARVAGEGEARERQRTQSLLGEQFVNRGMRLQQDGDISGAALCYAEALRLDQDDANRAEAHRVRLTAALRESPKPRQVWFHDSPIQTAAMSPDGKIVAIGLADGSVHLWDVATGKAAREPFKLRRAVNQLVFAAGGRRLWGQAIPPQGFAGNSAPGKDDDMATADVRLWDIGAGADVLRLDKKVKLLPELDERETPWLVVFSGPHEAQVRDRNTGAPVGPGLKWPDQHETFGVVTSSHVNRLARIWSVEQPRIAGPGGFADPRSFGRDGSSGRHYFVQLWDVLTGRPVGQAVPTTDFPSRTFAGPHGKWLLVGTPEGGLSFYDAATGAAGPNYPPPSRLVAREFFLSDDRRHEAVIFRTPSTNRGGFVNSREQTRTIQVFDCVAARPVGQPFTLPTQSVYEGDAQLFAVNRGCSRLTIVGQSGRPWLVDVAGKPVGHQPELAGGIRASQFSPDGQHLLTLGGDDTARVWDAQSGQPMTPIWHHPSQVRAAWFSSDGSHVLTVTGNGAWLWPLERDVIAPVGTVPQQSWSVSSRALSPDGRLIAEVTHVAHPPVLRGQAKTTSSSTMATLREVSTGRIVAGPIAISSNNFQPFGGWHCRLRQDGHAVLFWSSFPGLSPKAKGNPAQHHGAL